MRKGQSKKENKRGLGKLVEEQKKEIYYIYPEVIPAQRKVYDELDRILSTLTEREKICLIAHVVGKMSSRAIGHQLNIDHAYVTRCIKKAKEKAQKAGGHQISY